MSPIDIPLLRESEAFVTRLEAAAKRFAEPQYFYCRRVNWSHRLAAEFYARETAHFLKDPDAYIAGTCPGTPHLEDVYEKKIGARQIAIVLAKVASHWAFRILGRTISWRIKSKAITTYRKCYVDDIELVFDVDEARVLRGVYPYPLSVKRQLKYLQHLWRKKYFFRLDGNPYIFSDVLIFLICRTGRSLMKLEARAQMQLAKSIMNRGFSTIQLSDEFDIGSLHFTRYLTRTEIRVSNSAHGIGKYLPYHCYTDFSVLTKKQIAYYRPIRPCTYSIRELNDRCSLPNLTLGQLVGERGIKLVWLSQRQQEDAGIISTNESSILQTLRAAFHGRAGIELFYKPHPNRENLPPTPDFSMVSDIGQLNGLTGTVYLSFYSTCQIDPTFKGVKILIKAENIYPQISFDEGEPIMDSMELVDYIESILHSGIAASQLLPQAFEQSVF